jgi:long-chain acyl-CoA synthetase
MTPSSPLKEFLRREREFPNEVFLRQPINGEWKTYTWKEAGQECRKIAAAILDMGLKPGDKIALLSKNCAHWIMADIAIMMAGCVSVPLYPTLSASGIQPILEHSESKAIFIGKLDDYSKQAAGITENLIKISFDIYGLQEGTSWSSLCEKNHSLQNVYDWKDEELFTLIYTSGTTGMPKGVMHSVGNFDRTLQTAIADLRLPQRAVLFSYLPLSHVAERVGIELNGIYSGAEISFAESLETFGANLEEVQPHLFFAVPRIWSKFRDGILQKMPQKKLDLLLSLPIISRLVKKKIRKKLGLSRASHIISAAAPISVSLLEWFRKLDITILQALGMTEDCVYAHYERPWEYKIGSVGKPLTGLQVKFSPEGELCVKSPSNTQGYYKEPELSAALFDEDGYLKTGDLCEYDHDGFLFVTGRVKDLFKTNKGKYIAPTPIETKLLVNTDIEQVCVVGMGIPQPIALVTISETGKNKTVKELSEGFSKLLTDINPQLEHYERLEKLVVMKESWTIDNGLLTPTMKVKRNQVEKIHQGYYPEWFEAEGKVIWE